MFHEHFFELELFLNDIYDRPDPKTVNTNHVLKAEKDPAYIGYHQELHGDTEYKHNDNKENFHRVVQRKRKIRNIFKHLKEQQKQKDRVEKKVTLAKFRRFVFP